LRRLLCGDTGEHDQHPISADLRLPGGGVSEDDQRKIQASNRPGSSARPEALRQDRDRPFEGPRAGSGEITPRILSRELKALTASGLIDREDFGVVPPKVEYRLTRKGRSFVPVISAIRNWAARHLAEGGSGQSIDAAAE
jgi:DNA-binding HxlR family transcriptional regulator